MAAAIPGSQTGFSEALQRHHRLGTRRVPSEVERGQIRQRPSAAYTIPHLGIKPRSSVVRFVRSFQAATHRRQLPLHVQVQPSSATTHRSPGYYRGERGQLLQFLQRRQVGHPGMAKVERGQVRQLLQRRHIAYRRTAEVESWSGSSAPVAATHRSPGYH